MRWSYNCTKIFIFTYFFMTFKFIFCSKRMKTLYTTEVIIIFFRCFLIVMQAVFFFFISSPVIFLFFICVYWKNYLFITTGINFLNIGWTYFHVFNIKTFRGIFDLFFQTFPNRLFLMVIIVSPSYIIYEWFNIWNSS